MNVRNHFLERYVERNLGIKDKKEIKQYIVQKRDELIGHCLKMYEHAKFVWKGQIGDNITRNFYIKDDNIILTDSNNSTLVTYYKVDFGFPEAANRAVAKELMALIEKLQEDLEQAKIEAEKRVEAHDIQITNLNEEIKSLEKQLELKRQQKKLLEEERKYLMGDVVCIEEEIKTHAVKLCNSLQYKEELRRMNEDK